MTSGGPTQETHQERKKKTRRRERSDGASADLADGQRDWAYLPDLPLISILDRLFSIPDHFTFAGVCRSWRSLAKSPAGWTILASLPPILLRPALRSTRSRMYWSQPRRCQLQTLMSQFYMSKLSPETLARRCVSYSFGYLIFAGRQPLIADVFTGEEIRPPDLPSGYHSFAHGILTAPLSSPDCVLLVLVSKNPLTVMFWRPGDNGWSVPELRTETPYIQRLIVFQGKVFGLDFGGGLAGFEFSSTLESLKVRIIGGGGPRHVCFSGNINQHLVECGGDLLLVSFFQPDETFKFGIDVFRMNFAVSEWVKVENLADWSLFIDAVGNCAVSCINGGKWGGRSNCIYIAGPGCDSWSVITLDGTLIDVSTNPLCPTYLTLSHWPSPVWVYPSACFSQSDPVC